MSITSDTSLEEIAALVSEALSAANIDGVLGGGGAVTLYSQNEYMSSDLDFITTERNRKIAPVVEKLGFIPRGREYAHPNSMCNGSHRMVCPWKRSPIARPSNISGNATRHRLGTGIRLGWK